MKRILAFILTVCLMATLAPFTANAATKGYYTYTVTDGKATITDVSSAISGDVVIPSTLGGYPVTSIGYRAFSSRSYIKSISIPDGVTSIGDRAFSGCTGLTGIKIPDSVTSIGYGAFYCCTSLKSMSIGNGVTSIGDEAFYNCTSLTSVEIPDSVTSIGLGAFYNCKNLTSITIGDSVKSIGDEAFSGCTGLTSIDIPDGVTSIGYGAFYNTSYYNKSSNWTNNMLYIGKHLIDAKTTLSGAYQIKEGTKTIAESAFYNCTGLTSIDIPNSVTSIGDCAFYGCTGLTSVEIPDSVTSIGPGTFYNCKNLTSITIGDSVKSIGDEAFSGCTGLTSIDIPDGVTSIGERTFYNCTGLTSVTIGNGVTSIGIYAFYNCKNLTSITIGDSVKSIGDKAFSGCTGLTSIVISDSVTDIGSSAFSGTEYYNNASNWENSVLYIGNHLIEAKTSLSDKYTIKAGTKTIAESAFSGCTGLTSIVISDSVTGIGDGAFHGCINLERITLPFVGGSRKTPSDKYQYPFGYIFGMSSYTGGVATTQYYYGDSTSSSTSRTYYIPEKLKSVTVTGGNILYGAFSGCTGLTSITIGDSVTSIGDYAFSGCIGLTSITMGDSVTSIGSYAFRDCTGLTSIDIPDSVTSIRLGAFSGCSNLESMTIPFGRQGAYPFGYIFGTERYTGSVIAYQMNTNGNIETLCNYFLPKSLKSVIVKGNVGHRAFDSCSSLTSITIGDSVKSIGSYAFSECDSLTSITIPDSVTSIGNNAFYNSHNLTSVTIGDSVTSIGDEAFYNCSDLTSVTIGDSVTSIGKSAFYGCDSLTSITIPDSVTSIGNLAFYNCTSLTSITMGDSVTSIGESAFENCKNLADIYYVGTRSEWNNISKGRYWQSNTGRYTVHYVDVTDWNNFDDTYHYHKCADCDEGIDFTEHIFDNACDTTCNECEYVRATTHDFKWIIDGYENCGDNGTKHEECTLCHGKRNEGTIIPATGNHAYENACDAICNVCEQEREVPDHVYDNACDTTCNVCGDEREINHAYDNVCDTTCNVCGDIRTAPHNYSDEWLSDAANHWHKCSVCGDEIDVEGHIGADGKCIVCDREIITAVMTSTTAFHGDTVILTVTLKGAPLTNALAFDLADLPEGITFLEKGSSWEIEGDIANFNVAKVQGEWAYGEDIDANGIVLKLAFKIEDSATLGEKKISFEFYPDDKAKTPDAAIEVDGIINVIEYTPGDLDGEEGITANDAIYLLYNVFFGDESYPIDQPCDFDGDSSVTANDAIYLLYHVFFGDEMYPLA